MAWPEQRICGVTVKYGGPVDAVHGARMILHVIGCAGSWEHAVAWLLAVIVTLSVEQLVEAWLTGSSGSLSANGTKGLLLHATR
jgi:hypothetical protein